MTRPLPSRRAFLGSASLVPITLVPASLGLPALAGTAASDSFPYEVTRTDAEWRARLTDEEHFVLREGGTEVPHSNINVFETASGIYQCKGCDLPVFSSATKTQHDDIGWAFFHLAEENSILTGQDIFGGMGSERPVIEAHCRRCGSHLGHVLTVKGTTLHCINGSALVFKEA